MLKFNVPLIALFLTPHGQRLQDLTLDRFEIRISKQEINSKLLITKTLFPFGFLGFLYIVSDFEFRISDFQ